MRQLFKQRQKGEIRAFDRLVIETTGLADPAPIIQTLMTDMVLANRYRLDGIVTLVDAVNGDGTLDNHREAVKQAAVADRLLITKVDMVQDRVSARDLDRLEARLATMNPAAPRYRVSDGAVDPTAILNAGLFRLDRKSTDVAEWLKAEAYADQDHGHHHHDHGHDHHHNHHHHGHDHHHSDHDHDHGHHHHDVNRHDDHIKAFCITFDRPIDGTNFTTFLDILMGSAGENILRVKGILDIADRPGEPAVIHGVQHIFHPVHWLDAWPQGQEPQSKLVFITRDVPQEQIEGMLNVLNVAPVH